MTQKKKTITISESVNLKYLFDSIKKLLPIDWAEYELNVEPILDWTSPIYVYPKVSPLIYLPWQSPIYDSESNTPLVTFAGGGGGSSLTEGGEGGPDYFTRGITNPELVSLGVYCIEIKDEE